MEERLVHEVESDSSVWAGAVVLVVDVSGVDVVAGGDCDGSCGDGGGSWLGGESL